MLIYLNIINTFWLFSIGFWKMYTCIHDKPANVFFCGNDVDSTSLNKRWKALVSVYSNLIFSQPSSRVPSRYKSNSLKSLWEISWWPKTNQIQIDLLQFSYLMGTTTTWRCKQFLHQTFLDIIKNVPWRVIDEVSICSSKTRGWQINIFCVNRTRVLMVGGSVMHRSCFIGK